MDEDSSLMFYLWGTFTINCENAKGKRIISEHQKYFWKQFLGYKKNTYSTFSSISDDLCTFPMRDIIDLC